MESHVPLKHSQRRLNEIKNEKIILNCICKCEMSYSRTIFESISESEDEKKQTSSIELPHETCCATL